MKDKQYRFISNDPLNEKFFSKPKGSSFMNKPESGGLWCSPIYIGGRLNDNTWGDWIVSEDFHTDRYTIVTDFELKADANIRHIYSYKDIEEDDAFNVSKNTNMIYEFKKTAVDLTKYYNKYDGIHVHLQNDKYLAEVDPNECNHTYLLSNIFRLWDMESCLLFNLDCIDMTTLKIYDLEYKK